MNLKKNQKWYDEAEKVFQFNVELFIGTEKCKVDYALLNDDGVLQCYGYDLPNDSLNEKDIFNFLLEDREINGESSLMTKMFKFFDYEDNPLVFLTTSDKIYFMPNGIRQVNPFFWESVENLKLIIEKRGNT